MGSNVNLTAVLGFVNGPWPSLTLTILYIGYGGYGGCKGMDHGGAVIQEPVDTGNRHGGIDYERHGGYEVMGHGGAGPLIQEPVDTGNHDLDKAINKFYNCLSHTHEDPPTVHKADTCYYQTVGGNGGTQT
jgi:hypothetical protein